MISQSPASGFNPVNKPGSQRDDWLPLRRTFLPAAEKLLPYLQEIDKNQWYSNFGPLVRRFETALAQLFDVPEGGVLTVSSATVGLQMALSGVGNRVPDPDRPRCAVPAFSFPAAATVPRTAGYDAVFVDVEEATWSLMPDIVGDGSAFEAAMPVSYFGAPVDTVALENFSNRTGTKVVIDAAWCFDSLRPVSIPSVVSLHATKVLGVGEGGVVVSTNVSAIEGMREKANFGLNSDRVCATSDGVNAKMSEYAAAVGLAALDEWPERRETLISLADDFIAALVNISGCRVMPGFDGSWASAAFAVRLPAAKVPQVIAACAEQRIEVRQWWTPTLPRHPVFEDIERVGALPVSRSLGDQTLNLPFHEGVSLSDIDRISGIISSVLAN